MLGGRGAGKTRLGAEFVRALVHGHPPYADAPHGAIALVGETEHDVREVMIEGPAGILRTSPRSERPQWTATRRRLEWPNGATAYAFSAEDPEQLRGPQFDAPARHHHAAADPADQAAPCGPPDGCDARGDAGQRRASVAGLRRRDPGAL
jgi:phage terminase large subunit-like protein